MDDARDTADLEQELLVARCQLGEPAAFAALVERWHEPLWRYVRATAGDATLAEEVMQEAWLRILRGIPGLRDPARLRAWLFGIARRTLMDRLRTRYVHEAHEPLEDEPADADVTDELAWEAVAHLHAALGELSPLDRETTVLFYLRELGLDEVAQVLGVPAGTVKSRLHRARRILRGRLRAQGVTR